MDNEINIYTDGGARGNPGPAAIGFVVMTGNGKKIFGTGKPLGQTTNNVAEFSAMIAALQWLLKNKKSLGDKTNTVNFFSDSQLMVNQLKGIYKIKNIRLRSLIIQARQLEKQLNKIIIYCLIPREKNSLADSLVNQTLDQAEQLLH